MIGALFLRHGEEFGLNREVVLGGEVELEVEIVQRVVDFGSDDKFHTLGVLPFRNHGVCLLGLRSDV